VGDKSRGYEGCGTRGKFYDKPKLPQNQVATFHKVEIPKSTNGAPPKGKVVRIEVWFTNHFGAQVIGGGGENGVLKSTAEHLFVVGIKERDPCCKNCFKKSVKLPSI